MTTVERPPATDTALLAELAEALRRVRNGDFKVRLPRRTGLAGEVVDGFNDVVELQERRNRELLRISRVVGREGRMTERVDEEHFDGAWVDGVRAIAEVSTAVAHGDLSRKITVSARGEVAELADTINSLTDTLRLFAEEVTRVAREVGTEGKLGGQAEVPGVAGTWKDLTESVNSMASNLTNQVRNIAQVATAVAGGDLSQKITVAAQGEILELKDTVNTMVDQSSAERRVGKEGGPQGGSDR